MEHQILKDPDVPAFGGCPQVTNVTQVGRLWYLCKHRTPRACHPALQPARPEPLDGLGDLGAQCLVNGLKVISEEIDILVAVAIPAEIGCRKAGDCSTARS